jgi:hypothetical protein
MRAHQRGKNFFHQLSLFDLTIDDLSWPEFPVTNDARCPLICSMNMRKKTGVNGRALS